jgi:hypothetical protein
MLVCSSNFPEVTFFTILILGKLTQDVSQIRVTLVLTKYFNKIYTFSLEYVAFVAFLTNLGLSPVQAAY